MRSHETTLLFTSRAQSKWAASRACASWRLPSSLCNTKYSGSPTSSTNRITRPTTFYKEFQDIQIKSSCSDEFHLTSLLASFQFMKPPGHGLSSHTWAPLSCGLFGEVSEIEPMVRRNTCFKRHYDNPWPISSSLIGTPHMDPDTRGILLSNSWLASTPLISRPHITGEDTERAVSKASNMTSENRDAVHPYRSHQPQSFRVQRPNEDMMR
jgi:hypothetical protein